MVLSKKDFAVKKGIIETESKTGVKKGDANLRISLRRSHAESVFPLIITIFNGVTGKLSNSLNWPSKKSVTGKKAIGGSPDVLVAEFFLLPELQENIKNKMLQYRKIIFFCIRKFTK